MAIITDRDLLLIEPSLFIDAMDVATLLIDASDGVVSGDSLTSASSDFVTMEIASQHVVVVDGEVSEITARVSATELTVSRPRSSTDDPLIKLTAGSTLSVKAPTFSRQIDQTQQRLLAALGIRPDDPEQALDESAIVNTADVQHLMALQTIADVFKTAAALDPTDQSFADLAALYAQRTIDARDRTQVLLDLDGDGVANATRHVDVAVLTRS